MAADGRSALRQILYKWTRTTIQVAKAWDGIDAPWWYNERASLSTFAGAVWQAGGIAFEEFSAEKLVPSARGKHRMIYSGRCDMFFEIGSCEFNLEAKFGYSAGTNDADPLPRIKRVLGEARKAAGRLPVTNGQRRLAVAFIAPYFTRKFENCEVSMIERWIEKTSAVRCFAKAWVFPRECRRLLSEDERYYCPGTAIFVQEVKRATHEK